jgi:hypothetical protein
VPSNRTTAEIDTESAASNAGKNGGTQ